MVIKEFHPIMNSLHTSFEMKYVNSIVLTTTTSLFDKLIILYQICRLTYSNNNTTHTSMNKSIMLLNSISSCCWKIAFVTNLQKD